MSSTDTLTRPDTAPTLDTGEPVLAHIVRHTADRTGQEIVLEARVYGTPVEALCGHTFVPQRDPAPVPKCERCVEVFREETGEQDGYEA